MIALELECEDISSVAFNAIAVLHNSHWQLHGKFVQNGSFPNLWKLIYSNIFPFQNLRRDTATSQENTSSIRIRNAGIIPGLIFDTAYCVPAALNDICWAVPHLLADLEARHPLDNEHMYQLRVLDGELINDQIVMHSRVEYRRTSAPRTMFFGAIRVSSRDGFTVRDFGRPILRNSREVDMAAVRDMVAPAQVRGKTLEPAYFQGDLLCLRFRHRWAGIPHRTSS